MVYGGKIINSLKKSNKLLNYIARRCINTEKIDIGGIKILASVKHDWWNRDGILQPLHSFNYLRIPFIRNGLIGTEKVSNKYLNTDKVLSGVNILEVGCGGGILTEGLARLNGNITAIDPAAELLEIAQDHLNSKSMELKSLVTYKNETIQAHAAENSEKYDAVVVSEVLEHVIDKEIFLNGCVAALKPGGSIFITTFNKTKLAYYVGIVMAETVLKLVPENTHEWDQFISPRDVQNILESNGCQVMLINGIFYEFWRNHWTYCNSIDVNYALQAIKI